MAQVAIVVNGCPVRARARWRAPLAEVLGCPPVEGPHQGTAGRLVGPMIGSRELGGIANGHDVVEWRGPSRTGRTSTPSGCRPVTATVWRPDSPPPAHRAPSRCSARSTGHRRGPGCATGYEPGTLPVPARGCTGPAEILAFWDEHGDAAAPIGLPGVPVVRVDTVAPTTSGRSCRRSPTTSSEAPPRCNERPRRCPGGAFVVLVLLLGALRGDRGRHRQRRPPGRGSTRASSDGSRRRARTRGVCPSGC